MTLGYALSLILGATSSYMVASRGFGIITVNASWSATTPSAATYFFHYSNIDTDDVVAWQFAEDEYVGEYVYFYETYDMRNNKWCATHVTLDQEDYSDDSSS